MKTYIGTKRVNAVPMTRLHYNLLRGWELPADENGEDDGYLVEYLDGGKPNHKDYQGYISWSPKAQFENAYRENGGLTFGEALNALKAGLPLTREGWNGKDMFISLSGKLEGIPVKADNFWSESNRAFARTQPNQEITVLPCISMKLNSGRIFMGWQPSQLDILAEDWSIYQL